MKLVKSKVKIKNIKKVANKYNGLVNINTYKNILFLCQIQILLPFHKKQRTKKNKKDLYGLVRKTISKGNGAVVRTSAEGKEKEIIEDIKHVESKWEKIVKDSQDDTQKVPRQLYKSENIVEKMLMDLANKGISQVTVNDSIDYNEISKIKSENQEYKKSG